MFLNFEFRYFALNLYFPKVVLTRRNKYKVSENRNLERNERKRFSKSIYKRRERGAFRHFAVKAKSKAKSEIERNA